MRKIRVAIGIRFLWCDRTPILKRDHLLANLWKSNFWILLTMFRFGGLVMIRGRCKALCIIYLKQLSHIVLISSFKINLNFKLSCPTKLLNKYFMITRNLSIISKIIIITYLFCLSIYYHYFSFLKHTKRKHDKNVKQKNRVFI